MKDQIQIVSWLLTRRCNLKCSYCAIVKDYGLKPVKYPDMKHYTEKEMSTEYVIETLKKIKLHNPDAFHLFYGGEPLLRRDLSEILNFCNENDIHYTIITNNSDDIQPLIQKLLHEVEYIQGLTSSVDPMILNDYATPEDDRYKKCIAGLERLKNYTGVIKDVVAEITVDNNSIDNLYTLVKMLTEAGINSDITTVDVAKTPYYDFSNVTDESQLVQRDQHVKDIFQKIIDDRIAEEEAARIENAERFEKIRKYREALAADGIDPDMPVDDHFNTVVTKTQNLEKPNVITTLDMESPGAAPMGEGLGDLGNVEIAVPQIDEIGLIVKDDLGRPVQTIAKPLIEVVQGIEVEVKVMEDILQTCM